MYAPSDVATWVDTESRKKKEWVEEFALDHPDYWIVIGLYGAEVNTFIDVETGVVDVLRFGEGLAEGGPKGLITDFFRALTVITAMPESTGARLIGGITSKFSFLLDSGGPTCAIRATANALRRTGQRVLVSLDEVGKAVGVNFATMDKGIQPTLWEAGLNKLKVPFENLGKAKNLQNAVKLASERDGVVLLSLESALGGEAAGHRIFLEKIDGVVKFVDRSGIYDSLAALSKRYGVVFDFSVNPDVDLLFIPNATIKAGPSGFFGLFLTLQPLLTTAPGITMDRIRAEFEEFKAAKQSGTTPSPKPPVSPQPTPQPSGSATAGELVSVAKGNTLSGFSMSAYKTYDLWPLLWDVNRQTVGPNPNRLAAGIQLCIPPLSNFTAAVIADAKRRAPSWKNYPM